MELKKIYNKLIPIKGFIALTIWPYIFVRNDETLTKKGERHETTHAMQQIEMTIVGVILAMILFALDCSWYSLIPVGLFLEWYCIEWVIKLPFCKFDTNRTYFSISQEQEAYEHQDEIFYNDVRKHFAWLRYVFTLKD